VTLKFDSGKATKLIKRFDKKLFLWFKSNVSLGICLHLTLYVGNCTGFNVKTMFFMVILFHVIMFLLTLPVCSAVQLLFLTFCLVYLIHLFQTVCMLVQCSMMFMFLVKYLREVTPYFRKSSFLAEIGWTGPSLDASVESGSIGSTAVGECRIIPLHLCFVCRNVATPDVHNCTIELHAPDARSVICLRAADDRMAARWYTALAAVAEHATRSVIADANRLLSDDVMSSSTSREVRHIGWLAEKVLG